MLISDVAFASGLRTGDGRQEVFDDIGCMRSYCRRRGLAQGAEFWVHDFPSKEWAEADAAWFVRSDEFRTPMSFGYAAFVSEADARAAAGSGMVFRFPDLLERTAHAGHE
jgi:hypothetical protein